MLDLISQIGIALFGVSAIYLVGLKSRIKRWGFVCGLLGQPFWMYTTWVNEQWGIFGLTLVYGYSWYNGLKNHW